mmetsp:Transcript_11195/g.41792  ORF Transcript_11195/g.41792 Transcript_11195/m.41792 type:complete len:188 (-) Transcript_11195:91-654(-)
MSVICIGPICIPWVSVYAVLAFLVKLLLDFYKSASGEKKALEQKKQEAVLRTEGALPGARGKRTRAAEHIDTAAERAPKVTRIETEEEWEELLAETEGGRSAVVQFTATWCKPCQRMKGFVEKLSIYYPEVAFNVVDVDSEDLFDVVQNQGLAALPYFAAYQDGKSVDSYSGSDEETLERLVAALSK